MSRRLGMGGMVPEDRGPGTACRRSQRQSTRVVPRTPNHSGSDFAAAVTDRHRQLPAAHEVTMSPSRTVGRREFLKAAPLALAGAAAFPTIVRASALGRGGAIAAERPHRHGRHRLRHAGPGEHEQLPRQARGAVGRRLRPRRRAAEEGAGHGQREVRQHGLRDLQGLSGTVRARRPGRRLDRGARPLARDPRRSRPCARASTCTARSPSRTACGKGARCATPSRATAASGRRAAGSGPRTTSTARANWSATGASARSGASRSGLPSGYTDFAGTFGEEKIESPPAGFDYDTWLGPAPWSPYCKARVHMNWRWNMDYGGGQLMDWIGHHLDIAHWGLGFELTGPVEDPGTGRVSGDGHLQRREAVLGRTRRTPTARRWSSPAATRRSRAAPSGSATTAGSGWTAAGSRASPRTSRTRSSGRTRRASTRAATTTRTSSTACAAAR